MCLALADPGYDVVVVGGGPAGLNVALRLSSLGLNTVLVSASPRPGWPPHCTGLVSPATARRLEAWPAVSEQYSCAVFLDSRLREICRVCGRPLAVRVSRPLYEELLADTLRSRGVLVYWSEPVTKLDGRCVVTGSRRRFCGGKIVLAPGYSPRFSKLFSSSRCSRLVGVEVRVRLRRRVEEDSFLTVHGHPVSPKFFVWIVPVSGGREALVGLAREGHVLEGLGEALHFLERRGLLDVSSILSKRSGTIVLGPPATRMAVDGGRIVGLGDVLCASKPFTGGGLYAIGVLVDYVASFLAGRLQLRKLTSVWEQLRLELLAQRRLTVLARAAAPSGLFAWGLRLVCGAAECGACSIDYDRHSEVLKCLINALWWRRNAEEGASP